jgi:SpoVK/Ycf46/Vps4 family AAA+-type ATPase
VVKHGVRKTKKTIYIKLSKERKEELDNLINTWDFETKMFLKSILQSYTEKYAPWLVVVARKIFRKKNGKFELLSDPNKFRNWHKRYIATGKTNTKEAYEAFLKKEVSADDAIYLVSKIKEEIKDVVLPEELVQLYDDIYSVHLKGENSFGKKAPKKPFVLVVGQTGSGKTETTMGLIERAIFGDGVHIEKAYKEEYERIAREHPFVSAIPFLSRIFPIEELDELKKEEDTEKKLRRYNHLIKYRLLRKHCGKKIEAIKEAEKENKGKNKEDSLEVSYETISADEIQTMWYGETGNKLREKMGPPGVLSIRHVLEAHSLLGSSSNKPYDDVQAKTLSATVNKIMDEIYSGERNCIFIADTHSPEEIAKDTYRRFDELGVIIDISKCWRDKKNLNKLVELELSQHDVRFDEKLVSEVTDRVFEIFDNKSLTITPAYARKLIAAIIEEKKDIRLKYFYDELLVRKGFENVARNLHGKLYKKIVKNPKTEDGYCWDDYEGRIKEDFMEEVSSALFRGGNSKGVVLTGPPGSGKTFLTQVVVAARPEITYISANVDDLYDEGQGVEGMIKNLNSMYDIAKMLAPSIVAVNEADAVAKKRNTRQMDPADKVTNKYLDILDGDDTVKGTFTVMTTNLFDNLEPAMTRPGRLMVVAVDGKLSEKEINNIIKRKIGDEPLDEGLELKDIYTVAKDINNIPAGYVDFIRKLKELRKIDFNVICEFKELYENNVGEGRLNEFIKFSSKAVIRIIEALETDPNIITKIKKNMGVLFENKELFFKLIKSINKDEDYPLRKSHLSSAKKDLLKSPQKKAFREYDEFLSGELSSEVQVGKIVGAGFGSAGGVLLPINTLLVPRTMGGESIIVTGAIKGPALQESDPVEMTIQSAKEGLALNLHYFETVFKRNYIRIDPALVIGKFLENRTIHHQLETVTYSVGGPSAGFALAVNTLSVLLNIPVYHDFGITGAPGIRGTDSKKAGSSVIIGGEDSKSERVLKDLKRMFVPKRNYLTIPVERQEAYWEEGKLIVPSEDYSDVIPEILYIENNEHARKLQELNKRRIDYNQKMVVTPEDELRDEKSKITSLEEQLRAITEEVIVGRLIALYDFYSDPRANKFVSQKHIFAKCLM